MRSLTTKLTVAFLVMGVMGAVLVALIVTSRTRLEFDEFVINNDHAVMIDLLADYYAQHQTWDGVKQMIHRIPILAAHSDTLRVNLVNAYGQVVFSYQEQAVGEQWAVEVLQNSLEVVVDREVVGYLLIENRSRSSEFDLSVFGWADRLLWSAVDQPTDELERESKSDQGTLCDDLFYNPFALSANYEQSASNKSLFASTNENRYQITYQYPPEPTAEPVSHVQEAASTRDEGPFVEHSDGLPYRDDDQSRADGPPGRGGHGGDGSESRSNGPRGGGHGSESRSDGSRGGGHGSESRSNGSKGGGHDSGSRSNGPRGGGDDESSRSGGEQLTQFDDTYSGTLIGTSENVAGDEPDAASESLSQAADQAQPTVKPPTSDQLPELLAEEGPEELDRGTVVIRLLAPSDEAFLTRAQKVSQQSTENRLNSLPETLSTQNDEARGDLESELRPCRLPDVLRVDRPTPQSEPQPDTLSHQVAENRSEARSNGPREEPSEARSNGPRDERSGGSRDGPPPDKRSGGSRDGPPPDKRSGGPRDGPRDERSSGPDGRPSSETDFLDNVAFAGTISALAASMMALILGTVLARTLVRPIMTLTEATKAMSRGELGLQVDITHQDEIGQLATSFNQMSADLARAQTTRQQMTADIAHDLRTPLSILRLYTEGLENGDLSGNEKMYQVMHQEVLYLQDLVGNLHTLSLADAGQLTLNLRTIDPKALLERTGLAVAMQAEEQGIILRLDAPNNLPSVSVDTTCMTQVLNNLVSNALRFTEEGEIVLEAKANEDSVQLQVRDTGAGIAPEDLPHVFNRFYRADKSRQRSRNSSNPKPKASSGLGLAIAKAIVKAHDGTISVESMLGEGTVFNIRLPAVTAPKSPSFKFQE